MYDCLLRLRAPRLGKHAWVQKWKKKGATKLKSCRISLSWILRRRDLKRFAARTVRKIAGNWIDYVDWWNSHQSPSLIGIEKPKYKQIKDFIKYRYDLYKSEGVSASYLSSILSNIMTALVRVRTKDGDALQSSRNGFFTMFPQLRNFILGIMSDKQLDAQGECRFRCGLKELSFLRHQFRLHSPNMTQPDRSHGRWIVEYLSLAFVGALRGSELLKSPAMSDCRAFVAEWRKNHIPAALLDCRVENRAIIIYLRHMKNKTYYKNNRVVISDKDTILRILRRHKCRSLRSFASLCAKQDPKRPVPLLFSPDDRSAFVTMATARLWLKRLLKTLAPKGSKIRNINLHSPRAGFAAPHLYY